MFGGRAREKETYVCYMCTVFQSVSEIGQKITKGDEKSGIFKGEREREGEGERNMERKIKREDREKFVY